jgi:hypothetical protein
MTSEDVPNPIHTFSVDPQPVNLGPPGTNSFITVAATLTTPVLGATPRTVLLTVKYVKNGLTQTALSAVPMNVTGGPTSYNAQFALNPFPVVQAAVYFGEITCTWSATIVERATTTPRITP